MSAINKLAEYFGHFPGIGPRQSKRFVYFLLTRNHRYLEELAHLLLELKKETSLCISCYRFFARNAANSTLCEICRDKNREPDVLMIVEKDVDFESIEKSGVHRGRYFVLGGSVPILEKEPEKRVRIQELLDSLRDRSEAGLTEIVLALSANPEGENTARYLIEALTPHMKPLDIKISMLGRGLSTGSELEYSDAETIKNAFQNRA